MIKQLSDVSGLYARFVSGLGLVPIPFPRSTWEHLGISKRANALDLDPPPSKRGNTRRSIYSRGGRERLEWFRHDDGPTNLFGANILPSIGNTLIFVNRK